MACEKCCFTGHVPTVIDSEGASDFVPCRCTRLDTVIRSIGVERVEMDLGIARDGIRWIDYLAKAKKTEMLRYIRSLFRRIK